MRAHSVLFGLLGVVAAAAAVLSFAALRDLALLCGFAPQLAWLLPVVVDTGAAAGSLVWLGGTVAEPAQRFARTLALALLGLSVAANALDHGLAAYELAPAWWVVVLVSAIAPAVLGAVVHLAVLVGRDESTQADEPIPYQLTRHAIDAAAPDRTGTEDRGEPAGEPDPVSALIAAGAGRRRLSRELGVTEHEARRLLAAARTATPSDSAPDRAALLTGALS